MTLDDLIKELQYGELNNHGMFLTELSEQDKDRLLNHINIGLTALYTRFPLLTRELTIIQSEGRTLYELDKKFVIPEAGVADYLHYIDAPMAYPFNNDLVRILSVYDEEGTELSMNDSTTECAVFTPAYNTIEIPYAVATNALFIIYQAKHTEVTRTYNDIKLPMQFLPALLAYVAHRVYSGGTAQEHQVMANTMLQKYEMHCTQNREYGVDNSNENEGEIKPCLGGWI